MKTLLRLLKSFWFLVPVMWVASLLACWLVAPRLSGLRPYRLEALAIVSAFYLLLIVLRQYRRIRTEHNLENLVQREVDRSLTAAGELRDQQVLRDRLKHAIAMLRTHRSAGGGGSAALYDLPWYLVIGTSAAGKTSLLTRSGLSASLASGASDRDSGTGTDTGTGHCDWYFSPEAVMIDTAGRYLRDDQSASEFAAFLRLLKKQRGKAAINGLVLVVSLPELLAASAAERRDLATRLVARVEDYADCLQVSPPIYLMLSKTDQLPGFSQAFAALDNDQRQQPLGMTFGVNEFRAENVHTLLDTKLANLQRHIERHVDARVAALGSDVDSALLSFPNYFAELAAVLEQLLEPFAQRRPQRMPLLLRGLYFTSALQTGDHLRHVYEDGIAEAFALQPANDLGEPLQLRGRAAGDRGYFITDTFRRVIFPDSDLSLYQWRAGRARGVGPAVIAAAVLGGLALVGWQGLAFKNNRQWLAALHQPLTELQQAPDRDQRLASGQGLELLRAPLATMEHYRAQGVPLRLSAGLYRGDDLYPATQQAYLRQLRSQALEPIALKLQMQMRQFNDFATALENRDSFAPVPSKARTQPRLPGQEVLGQAARAFAAGATRPSSFSSLARTPSDATARLGVMVKNSVGQARGDTLAALRKPASGGDAVQPASGGLSLSEAMLGRLNEQQVASVIDAYNALKLYLVLTQPQAHPEAEFVAATLPAAWASTASEHGPVSDAAIRANTPIYLALLGNGQAPALPRNEQLVSETRERLKGFMISSSLVDREYLRLQLEASRQFPPLGMADLVPQPGRQLLAGGEVVPAIYTRQGWETFVKPELIKLVSGNLRNETDWVLDGEGGDSVVQKANFVREFMARYKRDYAAAWYALINSVTVRPFNDMSTAIQRLSLLSDVQNAPVKNLLAAVNDNTQWDLPAPRGPEPAGIKRADGFWSKVSGIFEAQEASPELSISPLPAVDDGSLAKRFEPVSRMFAAQNAEGADSTVMDRYLAALRKLKVRLNNIQRSQDVGKSSKQLISETLEGQPSEVTTVRNYVEAAVDTSQDGLASALQGLFSLPIRYTWETLRAPAGEQISKAWAQQIAKPWDQVLAHRYPIASGSDNEASVKDLQRFVDPDAGLLPSFKRNEIGNLAGGEGLGAGSGKAAPLVNPNLVTSIDKASALGQVIASLSDRDNGFEIMLQPSAYFTDILFTLDGQVQHYRNGKASWNRFSWPGTTTTPGARLDVITLTGERITVFDYPGRWGLLRMSDSARVEDLDGIQQRLSWNTANGPVSLTVRNYGGVKLTDLANVKALGALSQADGPSK